MQTSETAVEAQGAGTATAEEVKVQETPQAEASQEETAKTETEKHPFPINKENTHYLIPAGNKFLKGDEMFYKGGWYEVDKNMVGAVMKKDNDNKGLFRRALPKAELPASERAPRSNSNTGTTTRSNNNNNRTGESLAKVHADIIVTLVEKDFYIKMDARKGTIIANRHSKGKEQSLELHMEQVIIKPKGGLPSVTAIADFDFASL